MRPSEEKETEKWEIYLTFNFLNFLIISNLFCKIRVGSWVLFTCTHRQGCRLSSRCSWSWLFQERLSMLLCLRCRSPGNRMCGLPRALSVWENILVSLIKIIHLMWYTYEAILNIQFVISWFHCAAIIDGDTIRRIWPVSIILLVGQHVSFHQNDVPPIKVNQIIICQGRYLLPPGLQVLALLLEVPIFYYVFLLENRNWFRRLRVAK